ncbi:transcription initiation factor IIF [Delitschia confertaspora ATCC 74209]|uniref:Transcription initiation factor IIF subunit beta n=1 Tax=Delitschia confertaspora ATCC 74209 TaxID=1513339 RepID=A0A9P4MSG7_9PLEO|nr:transcription initiation factor IIF [Delitschia confertaspora ATCC 74209]
MNGIKQDPEERKPNSGFVDDDDDLYEDTGELTMPPKDAVPDIWLTSIPKWLWQSIADAGDDDEIEIGTVAVFKNQDGSIDKNRPLKMVFNDKWTENSQLPRAYELQPSAHVDPNTYIFTEKDLPGYKPTGYGFGRNNLQYGTQDPKARVQKRSKYRKAIPKHTTLVGTPTREYNAHPIETAEFKKFMAARAKQAIEGNHNKIHWYKDTEFQDQQAAQTSFQGFIRRTTQPRQKQDKAARIPKNELLDILHGCFDQFMYWRMKELKVRTHQPEAYLKETLQEIADLVKSGEYASTWKRKNEFNKNTATQVQAMAPKEEGGDDIKDEDDEGDDVEMEDVV